MSTVGKGLIITGISLACIGLFLMLLERFGIHGVPGDIRIRRGNVSFYFPIATCVAISVVLTIIMNLLSRWRH